MVVSRTYRLSTSDLQDEHTRLLATLARMGLTDTRAWSLTLYIYLHRNEQSPCKDLYLLNSEEGEVAVVSSPDNRYVAVETKPGLKNLIESIEAYRLLKTMTISGTQYRFGDFTIKVGFENSSELKSLLMQIDFALPVYLTHGGPAIAEIKTLLDPMDVFSLKTIKYEDRVDMNGELFSVKHSVVDLLIALNCIR